MPGIGERVRTTVVQVVQGSLPCTMCTIAVWCTLDNVLNAMLKPKFEQWLRAFRDLATGDILKYRGLPIIYET